MGLTKLETVEFAPDLSIQLDIPFCGMKLACAGDRIASHGVRIHDCMFQFACGACLREYQTRVREAYSGFDVLQCGKCHLSYSHKRYAHAIKLNKSKRVEK